MKEKSAPNKKANTIHLINFSILTNPPIRENNLMSPAPKAPARNNRYKRTTGKEIKTNPVRTPPTPSQIYL